MSALGPKRTCLGQDVMSGLLPKAEVNRRGRRVVLGNSKHARVPVMKFYVGANLEA